MDPAPLHADIAPLAHLLGTWQGEGAGRYPTIEGFSYLETVELWHSGKPFLGYQQRTRHPISGAPMHAESGYWRVVATDDDLPEGAVAVEGVIAHPTGIAEILTGLALANRIDVRADVSRTPTAKDVREVERSIQVTDDVLTYEIRMAAVGQPLQFHLAATLHRVA